MAKIRKNPQNHATRNQHNEKPKIQLSRRPPVLPPHHSHFRYRRICRRHRALVAVSLVFSVAVFAIACFALATLVPPNGVVGGVGNLRGICRFGFATGRMGFVGEGGLFALVDGVLRIRNTRCETSDRGYAGRRCGLACFVALVVCAFADSRQSLVILSLPLFSIPAISIRL